MKIPVLFAGLVLLAVMTLPACRKADTSLCDNTAIVPGDSLSLKGTWELSKGYNGFTGAVTTYDACNGSRLIFTDQHYERYIADTLYRTGRYIVFPDTFLRSRTLQNRIVFDSNYDAIRQFVANTGSSITLMIDGIDAPAVEYVRRK